MGQGQAGGLTSFLEPRNSPVDLGPEPLGGSSPTFAVAPSRESAPARECRLPRLHHEFTLAATERATIRDAVWISVRPDLGSGDVVGHEVKQYRGISRQWLVVAVAVFVVGCSQQGGGEPDLAEPSPDQNSRAEPGAEVPVGQTEPSTDPESQDCECDPATYTLRVIANVVGPGATVRVDVPIEFDTGKSPTGAHSYEVTDSAGNVESVTASSRPRVEGSGARVDLLALPQAMRGVVRICPTWSPRVSCVLVRIDEEMQELDPMPDEAQAATSEPPECDCDGVFADDQSTAAIEMAEGDPPAHATLRIRYPDIGDRAECQYAPRSVVFSLDERDFDGRWVQSFVLASDQVVATPTLPEHGYWTLPRESVAYPDLMAECSPSITLRAPLLENGHYRLCDLELLDVRCITFSVYDGQIAESEATVEQTPPAPVQIRESGIWSEIWSWSPIVGSTSVNLFVEFPGPTLCDAWASGERAVGLALPDSLEAEKCDAVPDTSAEKPVRVAIGERRVVVYQSEDLPGSITLTELDTLIRGGTVDRLGAVDLFPPPEDEWAYDVVTEETRTPDTEMDPTAWRPQRWATPGDLDTVLTEPSTVVVTSKVFAGFDDRVACVGVDDRSRCFIPDDSWRDYPLSRPLTVTADRLSTLELLWPTLTALNDAPEPVAEGYVIDVPQAVAAVDGDHKPAP